MHIGKPVREKEQEMYTPVIVTGNCGVKIIGRGTDTPSDITKFNTEVASNQG